MATSAIGRPVLARPSMYMAGFIGASFGMFYGFQSSFARLTGYKDNEIEVAKYGLRNAAADS